MKFTDISKVKRGDLYIRNTYLPLNGRARTAPALVVKVNKDTIDLYLPEGTEGLAYFCLSPENPDWCVRRKFALLESEMKRGGCWFEDGKVK